MSPGPEYDPSRHSPFRAHPPAPPATVPPPSGQYASYGGQHAPGYGGAAPIGYGGGYGTHPHWGQQAPAQSGVGVASFALAVIAGVGLVTLVVIAGVIASRTPGGMDEQSPVAIGLGLGILFGLGLNLVGLILGIVALCQRDRKKVFAVLGLIFNALALLAVVGLMVRGATQP